MAKHKHKEKSFLAKHKKAILIGFGIVATVAAVATVIILSGGSAAGNAVALGAIALDALLDSEPDKPTHRPQAPQPPSTLSLGTEDFSPSHHSDFPCEPIHNPTLDVQTLSSAQPPFQPQPEEESPYALKYLENGIQIGNEYVTYSETLQWLQSELRYTPPSSPPSSSDPIVRNAPIPQPIQELRPDPSSGHTTQPKVPQPGKSILREFFETTVHGLIEPELLNPDVPLIKQPEFSQRFQTGGVQHFQCRIGLINGMQNLKENAIDSAHHLSRLAGGLNVEGTYNNSHGAIGDAIEIFGANYWGYSPNTAAILTSTWTEFHNQNKEKPELKYLQYCHSQGAIHVKNALIHAPQEIRDRIIVVAIAPADIVPKKLCFNSLNFASKRDFVHCGKIAHSFFFKGALAKSSREAVAQHKELILLDPHPNAPLFDHSWQSPTFIKKIREIAEEYIGCNGEYSEKKYFSGSFSTLD